MINADILANQSKYPEGYKRDFDAHVYYTLATRDQAVQLHKKVLERFKDYPFYFGRLIDRPVGPHPVPMFEFNFATSYLSEVLLWLMHERKDLDVLVHQVTGDDPKDHYAGAIWLGHTLELDDSKLDPSPNL